VIEMLRAVVDEMHESAGLISDPKERIEALSNVVIVVLQMKQAFPSAFDVEPF
jgi:hypothetical protein